MKYRDPIYGDVEFVGLKQEVIENPGIQRLKKVHQNGANFLVNPDMDTSRFEHSLGVAILCEEFGCKEAEIIAGIVHDVSHTAFSHLADQMYKREDQTFHEDHYDRFVKEYGLDDLVEEYGFNAGKIFDEDNFTVLERDLPDICADRLDYTLRDLYKNGAITKDDVREVLDGLTVEEGVIVAKDAEVGHRVIDLFMTLHKEVFFNEKHEAATMLLAELLMDAMEKAVIKEEDLFKHDEHIIAKINEDECLSKRLDAINPDISIERGTDHGVYEKLRKYRLVDPLVEGTGKRISEIDHEAHDKLESFKQDVPSKQRYSIETHI